MQTERQLFQPFGYRVWESKHGSFFYTDALPQAGTVDKWTGFFDKQGSPLYENDIIRVHYDWKYGWVRGVIRPAATGRGHVAEARTTDGTVLQVGFYCFADSYRIGNLRQHPARLVSAHEQFGDSLAQPFWRGSSPLPVGSGAFN